MSEIEERLRRLREIQTDIIMRIGSERQAIYDKYNKLYEIRMKISEIARQAPLSQFMLLGVYGELISQHDRLVAEIKREESIIKELMDELRRVQDEVIRIQQSRGLITRREIPEVVIESPREREIRWLLNELRNIELGIVPDGGYRRRIIARLRQLGYPI